MANTFWSFLVSYIAMTTALPADVSQSTSLKVARDEPYQWTALGDSYASGVGAGHMDDGSQRCMRFSEAYPRLMHDDGRMIGGADRTLNNVVCSGAQTQDVLDQQFYDEVHSPPWNDPVQLEFGTRPPFGKPKIATLSIGGNDIDLKGLIMNCVYQFFPTHTCPTQQQISWDKINSPDLVNNIDKVITKTVAKGREGPAGEDFKLYVTGYGKLYNAESLQCNDVTFSWWGNGWPSFGYKMTQERRRDFNDMAIKLNEAVQAAVARHPNDKVTFVPWDDALDGDDGHRYCEEGVTEPDHNNPRAWFWQNADKSDQGLVNVEGPFFDALARKIDPAVADWAGLREKYGPKQGDSLTEDGFQSPNGRTTEDIYNFMYEITAEKNDFIDTGFWQMLASIFRVFHPKKPLHEAISQRILDKVTADASSTVNSSASQQPIPSGQQASCGGDLNPNFPKTWDLLDSQKSASEILYRMRDQACQGICQDISGVPGNFVQAKKQGDNGCEYAVKIAAKKELYFYATGSGQNCYDATQIAIDQCSSSKDAGWVNGPNYGEFYQVGVRDMNGDGSHHDPFPDTNDHLGYRQVACAQVSPSLLWDRFQVQISDWDDGEYGRTIRDGIGKCGLQSEWKYEDSTYKFADGASAQKYASIRMPTVAGRGCITGKIEAALGLSSGSVTCNDNWSEVNMF